MDYVPIHVAARRLSIEPDKLRRLCRLGKLEAIMVGARWRVLWPPRKPKKKTSPDEPRRAQA